ncbi:hypothetical protein GCM10019059_28640 [Camelimonas fluminis]|uniref:LysM peptidoglycan-binding domain-containing protein n=1 Tax=Camelimonas fluminis TaxID=1576911 RepID=A0ABV7UFE2_9HYPH|nr:LysM peptidoglycan-binding domain-containing protein [Camelimonas fluminis]GHE67147.1 hypothetical protein GCM10019059_28640 [Camelimonas fluminis]
MSEPALPPVNVKTIARVALALVALASAGILILTFGPLRDRGSHSPVAGAGDPQPFSQAGPAAKAPSGDASGATAVPGERTGPTGGAPRQAVAPQGDAAGTAAPGGAPSFDVVRVEPNGEAVIGGRARPDAAIELVMTEAGGAAPAAEPRVLQRAVTDASGLFAMTNGPLPPGAHVLSLRVKAPDGTWTASRQTVSVTIQPPKPPLVALLAPDRPTVLISSPEQKPAMAGAKDAEAKNPGSGDGDRAGPPASPNGAAGGATSAARISQVETDDGGRLFVVGSARPGATVRLYLNDALLASGVASASGVIEFALQSSLPAGDYRVRLDMVDPATGAVLSRAEAPWENVHATVSGGAGRQAKDGQAASVAKKPSQDAIQAVPVRTHVVARGDTLWSISRRTYQLGSRYTTIYDANQDQITDANRIYPGQVFVLPEKDPTARPRAGDAAPGGPSPDHGVRPGEEK